MELSIPGYSIYTNAIGYIHIPKYVEDFLQTQTLLIFIFNGLFVALGNAKFGFVLLSRFIFCFFLPLSFHISHFLRF